MSSNRSVTLVLSAGLLALGLLIGTLTAMSGHSLAQSVIAALFALFGGSLLGFLDKVPIHNQIKVSAGVLAISTGTMIGIYSGLYVNEHELLTPLSARHLAAGADRNKYLRSAVIDEAKAIDQQYRNELLPAKEAYEKLRALVNQER
jgi:hypothetical protein